MPALKAIERIVKTDLVRHPLLWCYTNEKKIPYKIDDKQVRVNTISDFVEFEKLLDGNIKKYSGIGITVNGSNVVALDIDKCINEPFNIKTINQNGKEILELFKNYYSEISFSGTGIRILFYSKLLPDFKNDYYIKNSAQQMEIYFPHESNRYVTITGNTIYNNKLSEVDDLLLFNFLNKYMQREKKPIVYQQGNLAEIETDREIINLKLKRLLHNDPRFLEVYVMNAPGRGKGESELDYYLLVSLFENVTSDITMVKLLFEESDFFKTKDRVHLKKWNNGKYLAGTISRILKRG